MPSIFSRIIQGELPSYKIGETEEAYAFLDISPLHSGHTLVVPKKEVDYLFDLPDQDYQALMAFSKKVAHAVGKAVPCKRVGVAVIGLEVPHAHVHLIPIDNVSDIDFSRPKMQFSAEEMEAVATKIKSYLD
ncbi:HIT family protein [Croceimicrobium hydrocarbonivorans]|uniref:HIT family protein n=1 Tax=Croceimicrobium hydrocarbonivorans TaxID=2761580 RepID=A0A7H0VBD8_9FLAO|nr:HIT family protein [Croceimicrobium hydrocarbonivorans]QNR23036.1 HIT family protein [Croceimicrobium hydrocarbonivorans]